MNAGKSALTRWGQWWKIASAHTRLRREVNELRKRVDRLDARVDDLEAEMHRCTGGVA